MRTTILIATLIAIAGCSCRSDSAAPVATPIAKDKPATPPDLEARQPNTPAAVIGATDPTPGEQRQPPLLQIWCEAEPDEGPAPLTVTFSCEPLTGKAEVSRYVWDFGDDSDKVEGNKVTHTFDKPGRYTARAVGHGTEGQRDEDLVTIDVE